MILVLKVWWNPHYCKP